MVVASDLLRVPMTKKGRGLVWSSREIRRTRRQLKRGVKRINNDTEKSWTSFRSDSGGDEIRAIIARQCPKDSIFSQENVPELWELFSEEIMRRTVTTLTGVKGLFVMIQKFISTKCCHAPKGSRSCARARRAFAENFNFDFWRKF